MKVSIITLMFIFLLSMIIKQFLEIKKYKTEKQREETELRRWLLFIVKEQELTLIEEKNSGNLTKSMELNNYLEATCRSSKLYLIHDLKVSRELINKYRKFQK